MKENQNDMNEFDGIRLSPHFRLSEFLNLNKYSENIPTMQDRQKGIQREALRQDMKKAGHT